MNKKIINIEENSVFQERINFYNKPIKKNMGKSSSFFWGAIFFFAIGILSIFWLKKEPLASDDYEEIAGVISKVTLDPKTKAPTFYVKLKNSEEKTVYIYSVIASLNVNPISLIGSKIKFKVYDEKIAFFCELNEAPICKQNCTLPSACRSILSKRNESLLVGILWIMWPAGLASLFFYFFKSRKEELNVCK